MRDRIDILMKNVELEWRVGQREREACVETLTCHNESAVNRAMLLHALAVSEVTEGTIDLEGAREIFPGYPGLKDVFGTLAKILEDNFPRVVWYSHETGTALLDPPEVKQCQLCFDEPWEEAILCPQCHGSGKFVAKDSEAIRTIDIFISNNVYQKIL